MQEWFDYEISPRNGELPIDCEHAGQPQAAATGAHRRRLAAAAAQCGCVTEAVPEDEGEHRLLAGAGASDDQEGLKEILPGCECVSLETGSHRRLAGSEEDPPATAPPDDCQSVVSEGEASSSGHRRLYYRNLAASTEDEGPAEPHVVTLPEVVADIESYYDEYMEIVKEIGDKASFSLF